MSKNALIVENLTKIYFNSKTKKQNKALTNLTFEVKQGEVIGTVGSTGRSTGPHLDFRINWFQTRLDPMSILQ